MDELPKPFHMTKKSQPSCTGIVKLGLTFPNSHSWVQFSHRYNGAAVGSFSKYALLSEQLTL